MRLIESIRCKFLPISPYLLEDLRIMTVRLTSLNEFRFQMIQFFFQFLTHFLSKSITLASGKVCKKPGKQHDLFLINRYSICILEVFLHTRNIIFDRFPTQLSIDEIGNIIHRTRSIQSVHSYQSLKYTGL